MTKVRICDIELTVTRVMSSRTEYIKRIQFLVSSLANRRDVEAKILNIEKDQVLKDLIDLHENNPSALADAILRYQPAGIHIKSNFIWSVCYLFHCRCCCGLFVDVCYVALALFGLWQWHAVTFNCCGSVDVCCCC